MPNSRRHRSVDVSRRIVIVVGERTPGGFQGRNICCDSVYLDLPAEVIVVESYVNAVRYQLGTISAAVS